MNELTNAPRIPIGQAEPTSAYENLQAHPLANQFDLIENGDDGAAAFEALKESISKNGIRDSIVIFNGQILDGRNRYRAAKAVGHRFTAGNFRVFPGTLEQAKAYVDDVNIQRRHLSKAQKDAIIQRKIAEHPSASNRQIARMCGVSHTRINAFRKPAVDKELERFEGTWDGLTDQQRERFVTKFAHEIGPMLSG
jgi:ParB-like chromosome segregation protein Spo0J